MNTLDWWHKLDAQTQGWLVTHNGEAITAGILDTIIATGAPIDSDAWWVGEMGPLGFYLSDEATDWIESVANLE